MNAFARISRQIVINSLALLFAGLLHGTICRLAAQDAAENPRPVENLAQFAKQAFFPEVAIVFEVHDSAQHYHVPLLLSPFGYSTYRGS